MVQLEAAIVSGCNGQTPPQNNISRNSSISVTNILKDGIFFPENELSKKQKVIEVLIFMKV